MSRGKIGDFHDSPSSFLPYPLFEGLEIFPLFLKNNIREKGSGISKYVLTLDRAVGIQSVWHESRGFILWEPSITSFPGVIGDRDMVYDKKRVYLFKLN